MKTSEALARMRQQSVRHSSTSGSLIIFEKAAVLLAAANTIQKTKELKNLAITSAEWARRKGMGEEAVQHCRSYAFEAERKMGELLKPAEKAKGTRGHGRPKIGGTHRLPPKQTPTLAELGISKKESAEAQMLAEMPREDFEELKAGKRTKVSVKREQKEKKREQRRAANRKIVESVPSADVVAAGAKFSTIVIDPPWDWGDEGDVDQMGRAKPDYATMSIDELMNLPVADLADTDCHLYLWITNRSLPKGFGLIEKYGFRYVTMLTWVKPHFGLGNYFRGQTEHVLFAVRGSQMLKRKDVGTAFSASRGEGHSAKPKEFYTLVESCSPGPHIELFSREKRKGWANWGELSK